MHARKSIKDMARTIRLYSTNSPITILSNSEYAPDRMFSAELYLHALVEADTPFADIQYFGTGINAEDMIRQYYPILRGRTVIIAMDELRSREEYAGIQRIVEGAKSLGIKKVKLAVDKDYLGVADWACTRARRRPKNA